MGRSKRKVRRDEFFNVIDGIQSRMSKPGDTHGYVTPVYESHHESIHYKEKLFAFVTFCDLFTQ